MIDFKQHPEIAMNDAEYNPAVHKAIYSVDYRAFFKMLNEMTTFDQSCAYRTIILADLFFIAHFIMANPLVNTPFGVQSCQLVQRNEITKEYDVEVWARGHLKSWIMTQAQRIQRICQNPERTALILSYKKAAAEKFVFSIMQTLENPIFYFSFPDIFYEKPSTQSRSWSVQNGIFVKRKSVSRKEKTVESGGLIEGMPTGLHSDDIDYDDVETADTAKSPETTKDIIEKYEYSKNLGMPDGSTRRRVIGTYYSHFGLLCHLRDKKDINGKPLHKLRIIPATDDWTINGKPIFLSQSELDSMKTDSTFNSQQLCNPTPPSDARLNPDLLLPINLKDLPRDIYKFMVIDQAGDDSQNKTRGDLWSYGVMAIRPEIDDIGASDVYILDVEADRMTHSQGISGITNMYIRNGMILQVGVEKVGLSTTEIHIANALRARGRNVSVENKTLVLLTPAGRSKEYRVEAALQWPLNNGKLFYSTDIHPKYLDAIREEMMKFPFYHVDILDMIAYAYDLFKGYRFPSEYRRNNLHELSRKYGQVDIDRVAL